MTDLFDLPFEEEPEPDLEPAEQPAVPLPVSAVTNDERRTPNAERR